MPLSHALQLYRYGVTPDGEKLTVFGKALSQGHESGLIIAPQLKEFLLEHPSFEEAFHSSGWNRAEYYPETSVMIRFASIQEHQRNLEFYPPYCKHLIEMEDCLATLCQPQTLMSFAEVCKFGVEDSENSLDLSRSPGLPWSRLGFRTKKDVVYGKCFDQQLIGEESNEVQNYLLSYFNNPVAPVLFQEFKKDEPLKVSKTAVNRVRYPDCVPIELHLAQCAFRRSLDEVGRVLSHYGGLFGVSLQSSLMGFVRKALDSLNYTYELDFKDCDLCEDAWLIEDFWRFMARIIGTPEALRRAALISYNLCNRTTVMADGSVVRKFGGNPSGNLATYTMNTFIAFSIMTFSLRRHFGILDRPFEDLLPLINVTTAGENPAVLFCGGDDIVLATRTAFDVKAHFDLCNLLGFRVSCETFNKGSYPEVLGVRPVDYITETGRKITVAAPRTEKLMVSASYIEENRKNDYVYYFMKVACIRNQLFMFRYEFDVLNQLLQWLGQHPRFTQSVPVVVEAQQLALQARCQALSLEQLVRPYYSNDLPASLKT